MSCEVYANGNEIACKAGGNKVIAEFPDVCLSPPSPPAGPIPVPYPDTSFSKDMKEGSKTVKIKGQQVMLKDRSYYKTSPLGDEAATNGLGANVLTHTITGKTYFVAWSMDVKFEGQNVDRHLDMTTSNHMCAPNPPGTGPTGISAGAFKPVVPGQRYSDQTCTDAELKTLHDEKDKKCGAIQTAQIPQKVYPDPLGKDKNKKAMLCKNLRAREQGLQECLAARQAVQDECFNSPKNTQDEKDRAQAHADEVGRLQGALATTQQAIKDFGC
jgi:hypothetical protein